MLTNLRVSLLNLWRYNRALLGVADPEDPEFAVPVSRATPLPVEVIGGSVGGGAATPPMASLSRTTLNPTDQAQGLPDLPASATAARIAVEGGSVRIAAVGDDPTPTEGERWGDGSVWLVDGPDLRGVRVVAASGSPALWITYLGPLQPQ